MASAEVGGEVADLHRRASAWYEEHGLEVEAFHHAAAAHDIDRAARLIEGQGMPLLFRGAAAPALSWLASLPAAELDARPALWVLFASALVFAGQFTAVEPKLAAAEAAIGDTVADARARDLVGHIAAIRATLAVAQHQAEAIVVQSRRALAHLHPDNLPVRTATTWALGYAHQLLGERAAARAAYAEAIAISERIGHSIITLMATIGQGNLQEAENQLDLAAETYRRAVQLGGDPPQPAVCEPQLGLARIYYEWNDLEAAQRHAHQSLQLACQLEVTDRVAACELLLARLRLARGDAAGAAALVARADQAVRRHSFSALQPAVAAAQVRVLLRQGDLAPAMRLARANGLPLCLARAYLAQGDPAAALGALEPPGALAEAKGRPDKQLRVLVLRALARHAQGEHGQAAQLMGNALALAAPGGFVRLFVDEGAPMAKLLAGLQARGHGPSAYLQRLLAAFGAPEASPFGAQPLAEPLSRRELLVLQLIAQGLSNHQISERLVLALSTVKGHTRNIFGKLQVERRTEAVARARELGLL
jgi:LuxR family maltose regulon positive regulatory protein